MIWWMRRYRSSMSLAACAASEICSKAACSCCARLRSLMSCTVDWVPLKRPSSTTVETCTSAQNNEPYLDRKSVVQGKSESVSVDLGGRRFLKNNKTTTQLYLKSTSLSELTILYIK